MNAFGRRVGAEPLGTTNYPVPPGAIFVAPSGNDSEQSTQNVPYRTAQHAVDMAPSGSTIVLRGGIYREQVDVPLSKKLTMQPYPGEIVWFSGSQPVTDWVADGDVWRKDGWTARFRHDGLDPPLLIGAEPRTGYPDMAFIDGRPLRQVASRSALVDGTFFVDEGANQLYVGSDPTDHTVEASVLPEALNVQGPGSVIRGLGFKHYATWVPNGGAVHGWQGVTFENDIFTENAAAGLSLRGGDVVRRVTATFNGQLGIHGHIASGSLIEDSVASSNNTDRFNPESAAGGVKLTSSPNVTMRGNVAEDNYGHALWFDGESDHAVAVGNITRRNVRGAGVMFELSDHAILAGNISTDNEVGLQAGAASHVEVWNNTLVDNQTGFTAYQDARPPQPVDITVRNNVIAAGTESTTMLRNADATRTRTWRDMRWTSDYNAFYRRCTAVSTAVATLADGPAGSITFRSVRAQAAANALERHSVARDDAAADPFVADASQGDYRLEADSPAKGAGEPLPADVADALGRPAGGPVDMGAFVG